jgi:hypothetical protein
MTRKAARVFLLIVIIIGTGLFFSQKYWLPTIVSSIPGPQQLSIISKAAEAKHSPSELPVSYTGCTPLIETRVRVAGQSEYLILSGKPIKGILGTNYYPNISIERSDKKIVSISGSGNPYTFENIECSPDGRFVVISEGIDVGIDVQGMASEREILSFLDTKDGSFGISTWGGRVPTSDNFVGWVDGKPHTMKIELDGNLKEISEPDSQ